MVTAFGSSPSHGVPKRLRPDHPLIACGECKQKTVLKYKVMQQCPNHGRVFYKCMDRIVSSFSHVFLMLYSLFMILIKVLDLVF